MMNDTLYLGIPIQGSQGMISGWHGVRANGAPTGEILLNPVTFPVIPPLFCQVGIPGKIPLPVYPELPGRRGRRTSLQVFPVQVLRNTGSPLPGYTVPGIYWSYRVPSWLISEIHREIHSLTRSIASVRGVNVTCISAF